MTKTIHPSFLSLRLSRYNCNHRKLPADLHFLIKSSYMNPITQRSKEAGTPDNHINVLYADKEHNNLISFKASFRRRYNVFTATDAAEALAVLNTEPIHIVLCDHHLPGTGGTAFFESVLSTHPLPVRILIGNFSGAREVINAFERGQVYKCLIRPWNTQEMENIFDNAFKIFKKKEEDIHRIEALEDINRKLEFFLRQKCLS